MIGITKLSFKMGFLVVLLITLIFATACNNIETNEVIETNKEESKTRILGTGDQGILFMDGGTIPVAVTKEAMDQMTRSFTVKDEIGFNNLFLSGQAFWAKSGTKVLVIDSTFTTSKVRILEGDYYGQSGWVPYEWVRQ